MDISLDNWEMVAEFFIKTNGTLENFEDEGFWPMIVDDYIDFLEK